MDSVLLIDNQELYYVFHTQKNLIDTDSIITYNNTGLYLNEEGPRGEIFVTAIVHKENLTLPIDFDDPCFISSNTVSIVHLNPIKIESWEECRNIKGFSFSISGGLPAFLEDDFYEVSGSHFNGKVKADDTITIEIGAYNYIDNSNQYFYTYEIDVNDKSECSSIYNNQFT